MQVYRVATNLLNTVDLVIDKRWIKRNQFVNFQGEPIGSFKIRISGSFYEIFGQNLLGK